MSAPMLQIQRLNVVRGSKTVVMDVSLEVQTGRITALLGPNGAGKSSLVLAIAGLLPVASGCILLDGQDIVGMPPDEIRRRGIAAVPEGHQVLAALSINDNLRVAGMTLPRQELNVALQRCY